MTTIVINAELTLEAPLSIALPENPGACRASRERGNFPIMPRGLTAENELDYTGYLPASTLRGFLRRAVTTAAMTKARDDGKAYLLAEAYEALIGQNSDSEAKQEKIDLHALQQLRADKPILDLFGVGLTLKSRLLVSHFTPACNVLPTYYAGVRKDLDAQPDVIDMLAPADKDAFFNRAANNSQRAAHGKTAKELASKLRKAEKAKAPQAEIEALKTALAAAEALCEKFKDQMGEMANSSQTLVGYWALPAGITLKGRLVIERALERDLAMIESALTALSHRPLLGAQVARGCGEISGKFTATQDGNFLKTVEIGGYSPARVA